MRTDTNYQAAVFLLILTAIAPGYAAGQDAAESDRLLKRPQWPSHAQHMTEPVAEATIPRELEPVDKPAASAKAHALQVAAFRTLALAQKAAAEEGLNNMAIMSARRGDQNWYVLVLGTYDYRLDAQEAARAYLESHPGGSTWVRPTSDLTPVGVVAEETP